MKKTLLTLIILATVLTGFAQVAINTDGSNADPSAMLEVKSDTAGLLIPRMTATQRDAISSPATGLLIYQTDSPAGFYYYDGSKWGAVDGYWNMNNNQLTTDTTFFVGLGTTSPSGKFQVNTVYHSGNYSSDLCSGGTASASEEYPGQIAANAFDNDNTSYWSNNNHLPVWIRYDLGGENEKRIAKYRIYYDASVNTDNSPNDWTFEASDDAASWTVLDTRSGEGWSASQWKEYTFPNTTRYRYYRLNISDNKGTTSNYVSVYEMEMMEDTLISNPTLFVDDNKVGIGTDSPSETLDVNGHIRMTDGNEAAGKVLISDANGVASWQDGANLGAQKINDLSDGKSDNDGSNNGSSVFLGLNAGNSDDQSDNRNVGVGYQALYSNTMGGENNATGYKALYSNTTGWYNSATGSQALYSNTTGVYNSATGYGALYHNTTGSWNSATGSQALYSNTTGYGNSATGYKALYNNTGNYNSAIGYQALYHNTSGRYNSATGHGALFYNTTGFSNVAMGERSLFINTTKSNLVAIGDSALFHNGDNATQSDHAIENTAIGSKALYSNTTGGENSATGSKALYSNTTGDRNSATSYKALYSNTTGKYNNAIGSYALYSNTTGDYNTAVGYNAYFTANNLDNTTCIGNYSGRNTNASNRIEIGNTSVNWIGGQVTWSTYSDKRIKKDVQANVAGLDFITRLRPVTYHLDIHKQNEMIKRGKEGEEEGDWPEKYDIESQLMSGFIAQEVEQAAQEAGYDFSGVQQGKDELGMYSVSYAQFVVPLVKATQELNEKNGDLESKNQALQQKVEALQAQNKKIEQQQKIISILQSRLAEMETLKKRLEKLEEKMR